MTDGECDCLWAVNIQDEPTRLNALLTAIHAGHDVDGCHSDGKTALMRASQLGCRHSLRILLEAGASIDLKDFKGLSAAGWAARFEQAGCLSMLVAAGAAVGWHEALLASMGGDLECMRVLLDAGVPAASAASDSGTSALMWAAHDGSVGMVGMLIEAGAPVDQVDKDGWSPLMFACSRDSASAAAELLSRGADPSLRNKDGFDAKALAERNKSVGALAVLEAFHEKSVLDLDAREAKAGSRPFRM